MALHVGKKIGGSNLLSEYRHSSINKLSFKPGTIHWLKANGIPLLYLQRLQIDLFICVAQIEQVNNFYGITPQLKYISKAIAYSKFGMIESELIGFLVLVYAFVYNCLDLLKMKLISSLILFYILC